MRVTQRPSLKIAIVACLISAQLSAAPKCSRGQFSLRATLIALTLFAGGAAGVHYWWEARKLKQRQETARAIVENPDAFSAGFLKMPPDQRDRFLEKLYTTYYDDPLNSEFPSSFGIERAVLPFASPASQKRMLKWLWDNHPKKVSQIEWDAADFYAMSVDKNKSGAYSDFFNTARDFSTENSKNLAKDLKSDPAGVEFERVRALMRMPARLWSKTALQQINENITGILELRLNPGVRDIAASHYLSAAAVSEPPEKDLAEAWVGTSSNERIVTDAGNALRLADTVRRMKGLTPVNRAILRRELFNLKMKEGDSKLHWLYQQIEKISSLEGDFNGEYSSELLRFWDANAGEFSLLTERFAGYASSFTVRSKEDEKAFLNLTASCLTSPFVNVEEKASIFLSNRTLDWNSDFGQKLLRVLDEKLKRELEKNPVENDSGVRQTVKARLRN